jgi:deferrochelatase/peroxidase EfeB
VRRGITYGKRDPEPKDRPRLKQLPTKDVGLLFMCFQASIVEQFEWILVMWILYTSQRDAMVSTKPLGDKPKKSDRLFCDQWPKKWDSQDRGPFPYGDLAVFRFQRHVTLKGGEYFFAPSISFLTNIAGPPKGTDPLARTFAEKGL